MIKVGDIVIVHDDKPRLQWRLAVVEDIIKGRDNLVRAAHIRMGNYKTTRPIVKLYPLEVTTTLDADSPMISDDTSQRLEDSRSASTQPDGSPPSVDDPSTGPSSGRPTRRNAASKALRRISE